LQLNETGLFAGDTRCHSVVTPHRSGLPHGRDPQNGRLETSLRPRFHHDTEMAQCTTAQETDRHALSIFASPRAIVAASSVVKQASLHTRHWLIGSPDGTRWHCRPFPVIHALKR
jgi:hypothetical protein